MGLIDRWLDRREDRRRERDEAWIAYLRSIYLHALVKHAPLEDVREEMELFERTFVTPLRLRR